MEEDYDKRVPIDHGEWCLGYGCETWREVCSVFHVDLQDQVYKARFMFFSQKEGLDYGTTYFIDQTHFSTEVEVYIKQTTTCVE